MIFDYWKQFEKTGRVEDYLAYRNSIAGEINAGENNGKSDIKSNRYSNQGSEDKRK
ncbi:MAG: hypothetical protein IJD80_00085 [Oscillospiraceae bacterium]|nr:hypothetical protein [Oscillospiraceae bacterium]